MVWFLIAHKKCQTCQIKDKTSGNFGQSLVEVLASMTIVLIIIFAIVVVTTYAIKNSTFSKNQALATKFAQEEIEMVRNLRDTRPEEFWEKEGRQYSGDGELIAGSQFYRQATYERDYDDEGKIVKSTVTVIVWWQDSTGKHESKLQTEFRKW